MYVIRSEQELEDDIRNMRRRYEQDSRNAVGHNKTATAEARTRAKGAVEAFDIALEMIEAYRKYLANPRHYGSVDSCESEEPAPVIVRGRYYDAP